MAVLAVPGEAPPVERGARTPSILGGLVNRNGVAFVGSAEQPRRRGSRVVPVLLVGLLGAAGCGSASTPPPPATVGASASTSAPTSGEFTVKGYKFPTFTASPGQRLSLVDGDSEPHSVTADDGSFDSGSFDNTAPGALVAPVKPGTYAVHCTVHPSMHGTLTVS